MPETQQQIGKTLSVWDTASLLIGIVVGVSIYKVPPSVFGNVSSSYAGLGVWALGALLALCGALCFSELATTYSGFGGEYQYLSKAYGQSVGFLFAWMQILVILTASIGAMAFVFADYSAALLGNIESLLSEQGSQNIETLIATEGPFNYGAISAGMAILFSSAVHATGIQIGKLVQNILTLSKIFALVVILVVGLFVSGAESGTIQVESTRSEFRSYGLALVFVMYAYGGWNDIAMVTPEVRNHQKNIPRALFIGIGAIAVLYLALNIVFLRVLGFEGIKSTEIPAAEVIKIALGPYASMVMSLFVMCSALGAIHGTTFASSRLLSAIGSDYVLFRRCRNWNRRGVPAFALFAITLISLTMVLIVGTQRGQLFTENLVTMFGLPRPNWEKFSGGFDTLLAASAPVFWAFFALSGFAVVILRIRDPLSERRFRVPLYPLPVIIFCGSAIFMIYKSLLWSWEMTLLCLPFFIVGLVLSFTPRLADEHAG